MSNCSLFFIAMLVVFAKGNTPERISFFFNNAELNGFSCKSKTFKVDAHSLINCCMLCNNEASCVNAFYSHQSKVCTGCSGNDDMDEDTSSNYFYESYNKDSGNVFSPSSSLTTGSTPSNSVSSTTSEMSPTTITVPGTSVTVSRTTIILHNTTPVATNPTSTPRSTTSTIMTSTVQQPTMTAMMTTTENRQTTAPTGPMGPTMDLWAVWEGSQYKYILPMDFNSAGEICKSSSDEDTVGHLVWVGSENENDFVRTVAMESGQDFSPLVFIGQRKMDHAIVYIPDGHVITYNHQSIEERDGPCVAIEKDTGAWVMIDCSSTIPAICERDTLF